MRYVVEAQIDRRAEEVFAFLSDLRNERIWNPAAQRVTLLTPEPIGIGSRFEAEWANAPVTGVLLTRYEPPHSWETRSRSLGMEVDFRGEVTPAAQGCRYRATVTVRPHGWARVVAPIAVWGMRRAEADNMRRIRAALEEQSKKKTGSEEAG